MFGRDGAVKLLEEKADGLTESINHKAVCRAAPGFAQMCKKIKNKIKDGYSCHVCNFWADSWCSRPKVGNVLGQSFHSL